MTDKTVWQLIGETASALTVAAFAMAAVWFSIWIAGHAMRVWQGILCR